MIYDPKQELTEEALESLAKADFDLFLEYLDSKALYLKGHTQPLTSYHKKRFAAMTEALAKEYRNREWHKKNSNK
jgi:hypothetical protein